MYSHQNDQQQILELKNKYEKEECGVGDVLGTH